LRARRQETLEPRDVDYLEAFRLEHWGKRDVWAWVFGLHGVVLLCGTLVYASGYSWTALTARLTVAAVEVAYFSGQPWARRALVWVAGAVGVIVIATEGLVMGLGLRTLVVLAIAARLDVIDQLFFRIAVPRARLQSASERHANNAVARVGYVLAIIAIAIPYLIPAAFLVSIAGLARADPTARPPRGRGRAVRGIVISAVATLLWLVLFVSLYKIFSAKPAS
jgi:hypothetical protein